MNSSMKAGTDVRPYARRYNFLKERIEALKINGNDVFLPNLSEKLFNQGLSQKLLRNVESFDEVSVAISQMVSFLVVQKDSFGILTNLEDFLFQNLMQICSVGANHKIRTLAISPSLTGLDVEFIRLAQQRYHFRLGCELNAKRRFRGYYGSDWCRVAENLDVGYCIYYINGKLKVHHVPLFETDTIPKPFKIPKRKPQKKIGLWQILKAQIQSGKRTARFTSEDFDETERDFLEEENEWDEFLLEEEWA